MASSDSENLNTNNVFPYRILQEAQEVVFYQVFIKDRTLLNRVAIFMNLSIRFIPDVEPEEATYFNSIIIKRRQVSLDNYDESQMQLNDLAKDFLDKFVREYLGYETSYPAPPSPTMPWLIEPDFSDSELSDWD